MISLRFSAIPTSGGASETPVDLRVHVPGKWSSAGLRDTADPLIRLMQPNCLHQRRKSALGRAVRFECRVYRRHGSYDDGTPRETTRDFPCPGSPARTRRPAEQAARKGVFFHAPHTWLRARAEILRAQLISALTDQVRHRREHPAAEPRDVLDTLLGVCRPAEVPDRTAAELHLLMSRAIVVPISASLAWSVLLCLPASHDGLALALARRPDRAGVAALSSDPLDARRYHHPSRRNRWRRLPPR